MSRFVLRLFVTGRSARAQLAIANLRRICEAELSGEYDLTIVDVLEQPDVAEEERVIATPMLVKYLPPPARRIIGDLSDSRQVRLALDLYPIDISEEGRLPDA